MTVNEGLLSVDDPVLGFFPDDAPANPDASLRAMRVRHLLSMNTGHHEDTSGRVWGGDDDNWPRAFLALPVEHEPGTWFVYNTAATYMLSAIVTKLTGEPLLDYLRPRLFEPLDIAYPTWEADPRGISIGGSGFHATTEDIARLGQLYLQEGQWGGEQLVPAAWIAEATSAHSDNSNTQSNPDWMAGYGYQFWRCRHDAYRGVGAFGQFCVVMPEQDAVLAITSGLRDTQPELDKVWEHLLPAMGPEPLPANPGALDALCDKLAALALPIADGQPASPRAREWSGISFELEPNDLGLERIALTDDGDRATLNVRNGHGDQLIPAGHGAWRNGSANLRTIGDEPVAASGAWTADDTFEIRLCITESEQGFVLRCRFGDDGLELEVEPSVSWGPPGATTITGQAITR